jgi:Vitamin K-dependent gamma-carboxylase
MSEERRAQLTAYVLASTSIVTFGISWRFWTPYRTFPMVPYISGMHPTGFSVIVLVAACVGLLLGCIPRWRTIGFTAFLLCMCFLILEDQSRLQPYIYVSLILAFGLLYYAIKGGDLSAPRIAIVLVYVWAGIHKLNVHYFDQVFPWVFLSGPLTHWLSFLQNHTTIVRLVALSTALMEVGAGVLLLWRKTRTVGVLVIAVIHAIALLLIGPLGLRFAPVVWPWNVALVAYAFTLFWRYDGDFLRLRNAAHALTVILFGVLPLLNLFSLWDAYLSFHAFSGATMDAYLQVPRGKETELPLAAHRVLSEGRVPFASWSMSDNRASAYPAERVYHAVFREVCKTGPDLLLVIVSKPDWPSGRRAERLEKCTEQR